MCLQYDNGWAAAETAYNWWIEPNEAKTEFLLKKITLMCLNLVYIFFVYH